MRRKHFKTKLIAIMLVLVLFISVGYAALTTTVRVNGTANIEKQTWLVYFTNVVLGANNNVASEVTPPSVPEGSKDTISLAWEINMDTPGQIYEFTADIVNEGTLDAMIDTATADIVTSSLTADQKKYLDYSITYINGAPIEQYDKLASGETKTIKVKLLFRQDIEPEDLPSTAQTNLEFSYDANYVQADTHAQAKLTKLAMKDKVSSVNYGEYVDLGTNILNANSTENDWRILYKNQETNEIYVVLADYLPNSNGIASDIGLSTQGDYVVTDSTSREDFLQKMNSSSWKSKLLSSDLLTKYSGIDAKGTLGIDTFIDSWNDLYGSTKHLYYADNISENGYSVSNSPNLSASSNSLWLMGSARSI